MAMAALPRRVWGSSGWLPKPRSSRGEFAEQIAVQIIHVRANEDSDPSPVAPDPAVSNDGDDLRRVRIENDVLGKDEILSHRFSSKGGKASGFVTIAPPR
jgi:hypothetical protein